MLRGAMQRHVATFAQGTFKTIKSLHLAIIAFARTRMRIVFLKDRTSDHEFVSNVVENEYTRGEKQAFQI
jgi:hypothetical protein